MAMLVIWASPNEDGLTAAAKDCVISGARERGVEVEQIHLNSYKLELCRACADGFGLCRSNGKCAIKDDFASIYAKAVSADGIVWVTAVYWHDMTENMKCLIDRLRRCETKFNHALRGKECMLVACPGNSGRGGSSCLFRMEESMKHMEMVCVDRLQVVKFNKNYMLSALNAAGGAFAEHLKARASDRG